MGRLRKDGLTDTDIWENLRERYGPLRSESLSKEVSVRNIAFNILSRTLERSRSTTPTPYTVDDVASHDCQHIKDNSEGNSDHTHMSQTPTRPAGRKPKLMVVVTDEKDEYNGGIDSKRDGYECSHTPRPSLQLTDCGWLHVGSLRIHKSGMGTGSPTTQRRERFLRNGGADFIEVRRLGKGSSGSVCEALHTPTLTMVALKMLPVSSSEDVHHLANELAVLQRNLAELHLFDDKLLRNDRNPNDGGGGGGEDWEQGREEPRRHSSVHSSCAHILALYDAFLDPSTGLVNVAVEYMVTHAYLVLRCS